MRLLDRTAELERLDGLLRLPEGALAVLYGRRRIGKTRLCLEWCSRHDGLYTVTDPSVASVQRRYFAAALEKSFPGFAAVEYPDWRALFSRLAADARSRAWRGPLIIDELPYLVASSPDLPGILQNWIDHEAKDARLVVLLAGSSQRMMQGLVLDRSAPLYGRAAEILPLPPLRAPYLREALALARERDVIESFAAWGGTPRYWELAAPFGARLDEAVDRVVLDPLGPLHQEPDRLLHEELPSAASLRPLLDAIGLGANRVSEIAGRIGQAATALSRQLTRLQELDLIRREVPFGESEKTSKKALYRMADPFFALWFKVVASRRALFTAAPAAERLRVWRTIKPALVADAWEALVRQCVPRLAGKTSSLGALGPWGPAGRHWLESSAEWDVVAMSTDGQRLLLGEAKWSAGRVTRSVLEGATRELLSRGVPPIERAGKLEVVRAVFLPEAPAGWRASRDAAVHLVTASQVLDALW